MNKKLLLTLDNIIYNCTSKGKDEIEIVLPKRLPTESTTYKSKTTKEKSVILKSAVQVEIKVFLDVKETATPNVKIVGEDSNINITYSNKLSVKSGNINLLAFTTTNGGADWLIDSTSYSENPSSPSVSGVSTVNGLDGEVILDGNNIHLNGNSGPTIVNEFNNVKQSIISLEDTIVNDVSNEIVKVLPDMIKTEVEGNTEIIAEKI